MVATELFRSNVLRSWSQESLPVARIALQPVRLISLQISFLSSIKMQQLMAGIEAALPCKPIGAFVICIPTNGRLRSV